MIKSYNIIVKEMDDIDIAVEEAKAQLQECRKNTVGIVAVHSEYIETGVFDEIIKVLPFPVIGCTTVSQSAGECVEMYLMSILVLTSDDCTFSYGYSDVIPEVDDVREVTEECYSRLKKNLDGENKLTILIPPPYVAHCSYDYISVLTDLDKKVPIFGTIANEESTAYYNSRTICNNQLFNNRFVMLLISGNVNPRFYMASIGEADIVLPEIGQITKAEKNILYEINDMSAGDFFESYGFQIGGDHNAAILTSTMMLDYISPDGDIRKVARAIFTMQGDKGICLSNIQAGHTISIAHATPDTVMTTADEIVKKIKEENQEGTILIYSCMARRYALLGNPLKEFQFLSDKLKDDYTFLAACSSGEICPISVGSEGADNQEHNHTIIVCVL